MSDPRESIAAALQGFLTEEQSRLLIDEVLAIKKRVNADFTCKKCGQRQYQWGETTDAKAVASALTDLANQAYGRPSEQNSHTEPVQFIRLTRMEDLDALRDQQESRRRQPIKRPKDGTVRSKAGKSGQAEADSNPDL